jgi:hypothetical protein
MKSNCWDYMQCGRELSGKATSESGSCAVVKYIGFNRINGGYNGGRYCWKIVGTFPDNDACCPHANEIGDCTLCRFYEIVKNEEGENFVQ